MRHDDPVIPVERVGSETAHLIFDPTGSDEVTVRYVSTGADAVVAAYDTPSGQLEALASFFREMADEWKGWDGERRWASLEGHIELSAIHDRVVILRFEMSPQFDHYPWRLSGAVEIEPGEQLSSIATGMDALFKQSTAKHLSHQGS